MNRIKKISLICISIMLITLIYNCKKEPISIKIDQKEIRIKDSLCLIELKNNTNQIMYFPINTQEISFLDNEKFHENGFYIIIYDEKGNKVKTEARMEGFPGKKMLEELNSYFDQGQKIIKKESQEIDFKNNNYNIFIIHRFFMKKYNFLLQKNQSNTITIKYNLYRRTKAINLFLMSPVFLSEKLDPAKKYSCQLALYVDSTQVKYSLLPEDLDSLKRNNIKIFHGTLYSNKVPLFVE